MRHVIDWRNSVKRCVKVLLLKNNGMQNLRFFVQNNRQMDFISNSIWQSFISFEGNFKTFSIISTFWMFAFILFINFTKLIEIWFIQSVDKVPMKIFAGTISISQRFLKPHLISMGSWFMPSITAEPAEIFL